MTCFICNIADVITVPYDSVVVVGKACGYCFRSGKGSRAEAFFCYSVIVQCKAAVIAALDGSA